MQRFRQQRLRAWHPVLVPAWVIGGFVLVGLLFLLVGSLLLSASGGVVELVRQYDGAAPSGASGEDAATIAACSLGSASARRGGCRIQWTLEEEMKPPLFVYYQLANFHQNHRRYVKSRSDRQIRGEAVDDETLEGDCPPSVGFKNHEGRIYWPCGLIARSFFNDSITLEGGRGPGGRDLGLAMDETGIAWRSDMDGKFANPPREFVEANAHRYVFLWETYNATGLIGNPYAPGAAENDGVRNEHFVVWMRTAGLPEFRKLYGRIGAPGDAALPAGSTITFRVDPRFVVGAFAGKKFLVVSTSSWLGGKSPFLGAAYAAVGSLCLLFALAFAVKHRMSPRTPGDTSYLRPRS